MNILCRLHTVNNTIEEVEYAEPRFDEEYRNGDKMTHTEKKGGKEKNYLDDHKSHSKQKNATEHAGSECYEDAKNKNKSGCKHKDKRSNEKEPKVKKRGSFIRRVLRKKDKHKDKNETRGTEEDNLYEIIPEANSEKLDIDDGKAVQMLSELQNILVQKVPILIQKLNVDDSYPNEKKSDGIQEITTNIKQPVLSEQRIPVLPHKTQKLDNPSPFHDIPRNNKPVALPPKKNIQFESLDDILDDLDNQNHSNKVKHLIKRFSEPEFSDVVLRTNRKSDSPRDELESDELSRLLEELAKVTNAPILTPGVTSSFNGSNVDNTEFSKLIFEKRRRHSEPDYDIPRPHKSLTILPRREESSENVIGSTRFFGPILKPSDMAVNANNRYLETPRLNSITPDSLETDIPSKIALPPPMNDENSCEPYLYFSYIDKNAFYNGKSSHSEKSSSISSDINIDNDIYVCPKVIHRFGLMKENTEVESYCGFDDVTEEDEEVFVDSLENNGDLNEGHTAL
ncbi:hypothetical protein JTB14_006009 [Gonioctena quinquepunctata]|nr:hypothetical protein JTB14_006009 [Gonioctena quinquepunctata]